WGEQCLIVGVSGGGIVPHRWCQLGEQCLIVGVSGGEERLLLLPVRLLDFRGAARLCLLSGNWSPVCLSSAGAQSPVRRRSRAAELKEGAAAASWTGSSWARPASSPVIGRLCAFPELQFWRPITGEKAEPSS
ncbi:unnamed protein product, partial [Staurois parvus]